MTFEHYAETALIEHSRLQRLAFNRHGETTMSEASETAANMIRRAGATPTVKTIDEARAWVKAAWPDWNDWIGFVMLDNIAEAVLNAANPS